ncbi:MAG: iron-containing alcohol dehydrogenase, partial [Deltaproteobacteria bacterium]|nr:iron-containing alcohol dehydrogenase [Deltaproteobacteria bacterium]
IANPNDYDARATFMWSATLAWNGILQAGVPSPSMPCHALEMPLSAVYNIAHGAGLSIVIPAWIENIGDKHKPRISHFMKTVFGQDCQQPIRAGEMFRRYYRLIGSPVTFREGGIESPDLELLTDLAATAFAQRGMTDYSKEAIRKIYNACNE